MYLESLIRLAEIIDHFRSKNEYLISEDFHKQTVELIEAQSKYLIAELEFKKDNPGPYNFGFGDLIITVFSPDETDTQEWALMGRKGNWQKAYRFNSITQFIKTFMLCIEDSNTETNGSTGTQERTSEKED